jgi:hypothetical protein
MIRRLSLIDPRSDREAFLGCSYAVQELHTGTYQRQEAGAVEAPPGCSAMSSSLNAISRPFDLRARAPGRPFMQPRGGKPVITSPASVCHLRTREIRERPIVNLPPKEQRITNGIEPSRPRRPLIY